MPSYLVTIRLSAETQGRATILAEAITSGQCEAVSIGLVPTRLESVVEDAPPPESVAAVGALSPAVVEELRQEMRVVAREVAEAQWDRFTASAAFRGFMEDKASELVSSAMLDEITRVRRDAATYVRTHIEKSHVQGGWTP